MIIKRFTAKSTAEALALARRELGEEAVILHTRRVPEGNPFGLPAGMIEVTVGVEEAEDRRPDAGVPFRETAGAAVAPREIAELRKELESLRDSIRRLASSGLRNSGQRTPAYPDSLLAQGLEPALVQELSEAVGESAQDRSLWVRALAERLTTSGGLGSRQLGPYIVVLIGPTGVGKTTTLAKLAAQKKIFEDKRVAFVTADTYRIAAIEQLRTFADIADIPIEVVYTPAEVPGALRRFRYLDYVFVDTAGRSQRNQEHLAELRALVSALEPDEIHLVLSLTSQPRVLVEVVEQFSCVPITHLLFTKLDESGDWVPMANLAWRYKKPISYITNGQCVPEDIVVADALKIAECIIPQEL
ncbi:MAG: flagellar biosynthesis protein FlhF [candidate division KSB1 bacterium]|nr:flagellar biosynthesis protein FlhF [candidate division KSB1 bacterium]